MKTGQPISKSVLFLVALGILLSVLILKFGSHGARKISTENLPATNVVVASASISKSPAVTNNSSPAILADDGLPPVIPVSLTNILIAAENGSWLRDKDYLRVPHQAQEFGGIEFLMDGMIQLQGKLSKEWKNYSYRTAITLPLTLTNTIGSLHLLGGTRYGSNEQKVFAEIVWHYTDGSTLRTPIEYQNHFRDWVRNPYDEPAHLPYAFAKVVWTIPQPSQPSHALRLYRTSFANPAPQKIISQLEFVSEMEDPTLFLVGVTLDPLALGQRPDASADLEPTDAEPPKKIEIFVQTADGAPVPQAKLQLQFNERDAGGKTFRTSGFLTADASGATEVNYPPENLDELSVSASHDDYGGRKVVWDLKSGDSIPETYTLKLGSSVNIGGMVLDETQNPIAAAKISLNRFWYGGEDDPNKKGEQADFQSQTVTTDAQGQWQAKNLPTELLDHIGFDVTQPDFLGTNFNVGTDSAIESQLRAGTMKIILHRGLAVRGLVTDENDNPISGATVWAGQKYFRDRQQVKTDAQGEFHFQNVSAGDVVFSVSAKGRAPDSKTFTVKADMPEIIFKLSAGHIIRAIVQDENGSPISGVRVALEGDGDIGRTYEFSATTDADGRFEWDGAPADAQPFYFGKEGYEDKRNYNLTPDQDNTVTLHAPRQLQGLVLDADSGAAVTNFSIRTGHRQSDNSDNVYGVIRNQSFTTPDGTFKMEMDEEEDNAVAVSSDDYAYQAQSLPDAQNGIVQVTIRLKPSAALHGIVTSPEGTPLPGVNVASVGTKQNGNGVRLQHGRLNSWNPQTKMATTDADGKFTVASPPDGGSVVAAGDFGFANVPVDQVRSSGVVVLQAWGRIEGTWKIGGQPATGKDLMADITIPNLYWDTFKVTTDEQGAFSFDKVPPGDVSIVRLIQESPNSWTHSYGKNVHVDPGQTVQVTIGDEGATVTGIMRYEVPPTNGESLNIQGNLAGQMPSPPKFNSSAEAQAFYSSPEWQALAQQQKRYAFAVNADGSFAIDDVAPGNYSLNITVLPGGNNPWMHPPIAQGSATVTVPDDATSSSTISIGEVLMKNLPPPLPSPSSAQ